MSHTAQLIFVGVSSKRAKPLCIFHKLKERIEEGKERIKEYLHKNPAVSSKNDYQRVNASTLRQMHQHCNKYNPISKNKKAKVCP